MKPVLLFLISLFSVQIASGQTELSNPVLRKNTFTFSYSPVSIEGMNAGHTPSPTIIKGDYGFSAVGYDNSRYSGIFMLSYGYRMMPEFEMTLDLGYEQEWKDWKLYNNPLAITNKVERDHYLYGMLNGSMIYVSKKRVEIYSSLGIGVQKSWNNAKWIIDTRIESPHKMYLGYQIWLLGIHAKWADRYGFTGSIGWGYIGYLKAGLFTTW